jgi:Ca2+-dependent lipid-binding protein
MARSVSTILAPLIKIRNKENIVTAFFLYSCPRPYPLEGVTTMKTRENGGGSSGGIQHKKHDVYSENLPIPSIQRFFGKAFSEIIHHDDSESEVESSSDEQGQDQKAEVASSPTQDDTKKKANKIKKGKTRIVDDPITQTPVAIHDVGRLEYGRAMSEADDGDNPHSDTNATGRASTFSREKRRSKGSNSSDFGSKRNGSKRGRKGVEDISNVMHLPFPPEVPLPLQPWNIHWLLIPLFSAWSIVTVTRLIHPLFSVIGIAWLGWWSFRTIAAGVEDNRWERERRRGEAAIKGYYNHDRQSKEEKYGYSRPEDGIVEGAEWFNSIVEALWGVLNSDLFSKLGSNLEDVLQASTHEQAFIQAVKVEDIGQGTTPFRVTAVRVLGNEESYEMRRQAQQEMKQRLGKERSDLPQEGETKRDIPTLQDEECVQRSIKADKADDHADAEGNFINLEVSFVYRARPTSKGVVNKTRNAHLMIKFWLGAHKWYHVPVPVWVEIKGFVGKVRARIQLVPDPPFIKNVSFSFMGLPRTEVTVIPLKINTTNIPYLSGFIQKSIDAAIGEYCAPSSLTIDVGEAIAGDNIKREVNAMGIVIVILHRAFDLEKQDVRGSSDPYCTVALKKNGKVQYCTRVAVDDLSPRWEEIAYLIVNPEAVRVKEKVQVSLWDSDRLSADDVLGSCEVDLQALVRKPGRIFRRTDTLVGLTKELKKQGTLRWSVAYYEKTPNTRRWDNKEDQLKEEEEADRTRNRQVELAEQDGEQEENVERDMHELDNDDGEGDLHLPEEDGKQTRNQEHAVSTEPPSKGMPSGILAIQVHQIDSLEVVDNRTHLSRRRSVDTAQQVDNVEDHQDEPSSPSPYVTIVLNDETIFRSRVKALNSSPFFNAGTERLVTDWTKCIVMFVVYDARLREDDAILGVVALSLADVFKEASQITSYFPLSGGVGMGRIRISLLFRPLQDTVKKAEKLGWNIGTMQIRSSLMATDFVPTFSSTALRFVSLRLSTIAGKCRISATRCSLSHKDKEHNDEMVEWHLKENEVPLKIPVRRRYAAPFVIEFRAISAIGKRKTIAMCIVWMQDIADNEIVDHKLSIYQANQGNDFHRFMQNYHDYRKEEEANELGVHKVGNLHISMQFKSGAGMAHVKSGKRNKDVKEVLDAWACCTAAGLRNVRGDFAEPIPDHKVGRPSREEEDGSSDSSSGSSSEDEDEPKEGRQAKERQNKSSMEINDNDNGDDDHPGLFDRLKDWKDERKELHRQHKGSMQYKATRTATWLSKGVRDSGNKAVHSLGFKEKRGAQVESEL